MSEQLLNQKPKRPCGHPRCAELTTLAYCETHRPSYERAEDRPSAAKRGYNYEWQKARVLFLRRHPLCVHCLLDGFVTSATDIDHIVPHRGNRKLFWDTLNWQALCKSHHSKKTASEDGGFRNQPNPSKIDGAGG